MFDMNLAEAEINNNYTVFGNNDEKKRELLNSVLEKHKISKQELDTSLVWYSAHLERYLKICDRVSKRYDNQIGLLQKEIEEENALIAELNRVNIFRGERSFFLQAASLLQNTVSFKVDSLEWNVGDNLEISFDVTGLGKDMNPGLLCYVVCKDTIIMVQDKIRTNGNFSKLMPYGMNKVESFSVSIHLSDSIPNANILINKFGLFHRKKYESQLLLGSPQILEREIQ